MNPVAVTPAESSRRELFLPLVAGYFALPVLIFLFGWLRPAIGIPAGLVVAGVYFWFVRRPSQPARPALTQKNLLLILTVTFAWTLLAGVGGVLPQSSDYLKHNLLLHDLTSTNWPVTYPHEGGENFLCYALGYYLVPALGGRLLGADIIPVLLFVWTFAGLFLFFWWAVTLTASPKKIIAAILLFAPTGILWSLFKTHGLTGIVTTAGLEPKLLYGGLLFGYNDSFTRFFYQPQHALTGWLGAAVLYELLWVKKNPRGAIFIWSLFVFWSPLTSLGLLLVPLAAWGRVCWRNYFEPVNLIGGGVLLAALGIYFQGHVPLPDKGFIGTFLPGLAWPLYYALFILLLLAPVGLLWLVEWKGKILGEFRPLFMVASALLLLLPLWKFGVAGDLRNQAGAPALLFVALAAARIVQSEKFSWQPPLGFLLTALLLLGAAGAVFRPLKNLTASPPDYAYANIAQSLGWHSLADLTDPRFDLAAQYQGRSDSAAAIWLLRKNPTPATP